MGLWSTALLATVFALGHVAEANAPVPNTCVLWMRVADGASLNPPTFINQSAECTGACANSSCRIVQISSTTTGSVVVVVNECLCALGGGAPACKGQEHTTSTNGGATISSRTIRCVGTCPVDDDENTPPLACDGYFDPAQPAPAGHTGHWIRCKCLPGTAGD